MFLLLFSYFIRAFILLYVVSKLFLGVLLLFLGFLFAM